MSLLEASRILCEGLRQAICCQKFLGVQNANLTNTVLLTRQRLVSDYIFKPYNFCSTCISSQHKLKCERLQCSARGRTVPESEREGHPHMQTLQTSAFGPRPQMTENGRDVPFVSRRTCRLAPIRPRTAALFASDGQSSTQSGSSMTGEADVQTLELTGSRQGSLPIGH